MKTKIYSFLLMLTFAGGLMMKGQNPGSIPLPTENASSPEPGKKILITLNAQNFSAKEAPKSTKTNLPETTTEAANPEQVDKLLKQVDELNNMIFALRKEAKNSQPDRKSVLTEQANNLEYISMTKQVEASDMTGKINLQKYTTNRKTINNMLEMHEGKAILNHTRFLISESEKNMKIALELRQEAASVKNLPSKIGTMSNAEEKEVLALGNQNDAIGLLRKSLN